MTCHSPNLGSASDCRVCTLFGTKNSWTFQGLSRTLFPFLKDSIQCKKSLESVFCSSSTTRVISSRQDFQGACEPFDLSCRMANLLPPIRSTLRSGWSCIISLEILCSFLRCHFMGKPVEHEKTVDVAMPTNDPKETLFTL